MPIYVTYDAPSDLQEDVLETVEIARDTGSVKKGTNETTKAIERGTAELVVIAEDVQPEEIVMHLPELADEKNAPFVFVEAQDELGRAAGLEVGCAAVAVIDAGQASETLSEIVDRIEDLR